MDRGKTWVLAAWLIFGAAIAVASPSAYCKFKYYRHEVTQTDLNGRKCSDNVTIQSCGGYCLSHEIPHWQFPYKESHHPVCVHGDRKHASFKLRFCDPGVDPGFRIYHYLEADSCKCQVCSSDNTSCEWLPPDTSLLSKLIRLKEEKYTENMIE